MTGVQTCALPISHLSNTFASSRISLPNVTPVAQTGLRITLRATNGLAMSSAVTMTAAVIASFAVFLLIQVIAKFLGSIVDIGKAIYEYIQKKEAANEDKELKPTSINKALNVASTILNGIASFDLSKLIHSVAKVGTTIMGLLGEIPAIANNTVYKKIMWGVKSFELFLTGTAIAGSIQEAATQDGGIGASFTDGDKLATKSGNSNNFLNDKAIFGEISNGDYGTSGLYATIDTMTGAVNDIKDGGVTIYEINQERKELKEEQEAIKKKKQLAKEQGASKLLQDALKNLIVLNDELITLNEQAQKEKNKAKQTKIIKKKLPTLAKKKKTVQELERGWNRNNPGKKKIII